MNDDDIYVDWFAITLDPEQDIRRKCAFCKDTKRSPLDDPELWENDYKTTSCRHRVCRICQKNHPPGQSKCGLCGAKVVQYTAELPEYLALRTLNEIRRDVFKEWNLTEEDFANSEAYSKFLEEREHIIAQLIFARSADAKTKEAVEKEVQSTRAAFRAKHQEAIARNEAKRTEHMLRLEDQFRAWHREQKRLKKLMEEEYILQEEERERLKENANYAALGLKIQVPSAVDGNGGAFKSHYEKPEGQTYMPRYDMLAFAGPPPVVVKSTTKRAKMDPEVVALVGGFTQSLVLARGLSELRSGWELLTS